MCDWKKFEQKVCEYASYIWNRTSEKKRVAGVDVDCVLEVELDSWVVIEITQNKTLEKIRGDIIKIKTVKNELFTKNIHSKSFIVCNFEPTSAMVDAGKESFINVVSFERFQKMFFDFVSYKISRENKQFGSAIDPETGKKDNSSYTPVSYIDKNTGIEYKITDIKNELNKNKKIVLLGDFGTGKSRCFQELFINMSNEYRETMKYPISIDLRNTWGLINATEIIRRHLESLGIKSDSIDNVIKSYENDNFCFLLDGFDEVGSKPWSENPKKLEELRKSALQGVKDLISKTDGGVIISGRYHYFNTDEEMLKSLGLYDSNTLVLECKNEFDYEEFICFMKQNNLELEIPDWIPKKPLILKTIASYDSETIKKLFEANTEGIGFWFTFINLMCERDAKIHSILDADIIKEVLITLSRYTRIKSQDVGPLSENELAKAFTEVTGIYPNEQATVMLQRLPGLGRVKAESGERSFIDVFILDGLRGLDVEKTVMNTKNEEWESTWIQPLRQLGQKVLAYRIEKEYQNGKCSDGVYIEKSKRMIDKDINNKTLISDIIGALSIVEGRMIDYDFRTINDAHFGYLNLSKNRIDKLKIVDCIFENITLGVKDPENISISDSIIENIEGIPSKDGIPSWIDSETCKIENFKTIDNLASIKKSVKLNAHKILVSILIKVYKQKGGGRKENTLTKGLNSVDPKLLKKIIKYLISTNVLFTSKNESGEIIYKPNKKYTQRINAILNDLERSKDEIWINVKNLEKRRAQNNKNI